MRDERRHDLAVLHIRLSRAASLKQADRDSEQDDDVEVVVYASADGRAWTEAAENERSRQEHMA